jgi:hypothetical protein
MKCIVKDCENHVHQGNFVGAICAPCNQFLTTGEGKYSQLYRNTVAAEREACAQVCEAIAQEMYDQGEGPTGYISWVNDCYLRIRARGNK